LCVNGWVHRSTNCVFPHIFTCSQVEDLLAVEVGIEVEIEAFQRFGTVESTLAQSQLELFLGAAFQLIFQSTVKELYVAPLIIDSLAVAGFQGFQKSTETQMA